MTEYSFLNIEPCNSPLALYGRKQCGLGSTEKIKMNTGLNNMMNIFICGCTIVITLIGQLIFTHICSYLLR